jgi:hypothetical protein
MASSVDSHRQRVGLHLSFHLRLTCGRNGFEYLLEPGHRQKNGHPNHPQPQGKTCEDLPRVGLTRPRAWPWCPSLICRSALVQRRGAHRPDGSDVIELGREAPSQTCRSARPVRPVSQISPNLTEALSPLRTEPSPQPPLSMPLSTLLPLPEPAQERRSRLQSPGMWQPWSAGTVITYELMPTKEDGKDGLPAMEVPARRGVRRGS